MDRQRQFAACSSSRSSARPCWLGRTSPERPQSLGMDFSARCANGSFLNGAAARPEGCHGRRCYVERTAEPATSAMDRIADLAGRLGVEADYGLTVTAGNLPESRLVDRVQEIAASSSPASGATGADTHRPRPTVPSRNSRRCGSAICRGSRLLRHAVDVLRRLDAKRRRRRPPRVEAVHHVR